MSQSAWLIREKKEQLFQKKIKHDLSSMLIDHGSGLHVIGFRMPRWSIKNDVSTTNLMRTTERNILLRCCSASSKVSINSYTQTYAHWVWRKMVGTAEKRQNPWNRPNIQIIFSYECENTCYFSQHHWEDDLFEFPHHLVILLWRRRKKNKNGCHEDFPAFHFWYDSSSSQLP